MEEQLKSVSKKGTSWNREPCSSNLQRTKALYSITKSEAR